MQFPNWWDSFMRHHLTMNVLATTACNLTRCTWLGVCRTVHVCRGVGRIYAWVWKQWCKANRLCFIKIMKGCTLIIIVFVMVCIIIVIFPLKLHKHVSIGLPWTWWQHRRPCRHWSEHYANPTLYGSIYCYFQDYFMLVMAICIRLMMMCSC